MRVRKTSLSPLFMRFPEKKSKIEEKFYFLHFLVIRNRGDELSCS